MRRLLRSGLFGATGCLVTSSALAYCPSYTLSSSANDRDCGIEAAPGTNPTVAEWQAIFDKVAKGPAAWAGDGPDISDIKTGCDKPKPVTDAPPVFPCEILKAIGHAESGWQQFCVPDRPADQVGGAERTIISFDCGYGIGQITSGMHIGETPNYDRQRVASDPFYNLATGAQILAGKWRAVKCVGDRQPSIVEHWYTAVWAYNGLAYTNNPSNPKYSSTRGVWNPAVGGSSPYQEKVFGYVEYPQGTPARWESVPVAYPNPSTVGTTGKPPDLDEPSCASPTDCSATRSTHLSNCFAASGSGGASGAGGASGSGGQAGAAGQAGAGGAGIGAGGAGGGATAGNGGTAGLSAGGTTATGGTTNQVSRFQPGDDSGCGCQAVGASSSVSDFVHSLVLTLGT